MSEHDNLLLDRLEHYQSLLLDLKRSNRCVCLTQLRKTHSFDMTRLAEEHRERIHDATKQAFLRKKPVCILPDSADDEKSDLMRGNLKTLYRSTKTLEDETGSQYTYLGFPFLEGHTNDGYVRGPLVLFPINLGYRQVKREMGWAVEFQKRAPIYNHTLFKAMDKTGGIRMDDTFESDFEEMLADLDDKTTEEEFMVQLDGLLRRHGLDLRPLGTIYDEKTGELVSASSTLRKKDEDEIQDEDSGTKTAGSEQADAADQTSAGMQNMKDGNHDATAAVEEIIQKHISEKGIDRIRALLHIEITDPDLFNDYMNGNPRPDDLEIFNRINGSPRKTGPAPQTKTQDSKEIPMQKDDAASADSQKDSVQDDPIQEEINSATLTIRFKSMTRKNIENIKERRKLGISNYKIIGSFPQGESAIYQDYDALCKKMEDGEGVGDFISDILGDADDIDYADEEYGKEIEQHEIKLDKIKDYDYNIISPSDSSQDQVILQTQNSKITLVRGPPGTGKSQVIVNAIANALSKDQKVLVVCQKRAALEVVNQRLAEKDLDKYTVLLSKEREDRANMYLKLRQILEQPVHASDYNEKMIEGVSKEIDSLIARHSELAFALAKEYFGGIWISKVYALASSKYAKRLSLEGIAGHIKYPELDGFLAGMQQLMEGYRKFDGAEYPWKNRKDFADLNHNDENKIRKAISDIMEISPNYTVLRDSHRQQRSVDLASRYTELEEKSRETRQREESMTGSAKEIFSIYEMDEELKDVTDMSESARAGVALWDHFGDHETILAATRKAIIRETYAEQADLVASFADSKASFWKRKTDSEIKRRIKLHKEFLSEPASTGKKPQELEDMLATGLELWNLARDSQTGENLLKRPLIIPNDAHQRKTSDILSDIRDARQEARKYEADLHDITESLRDLLERDHMIFHATEVEESIKKLVNGRKILQSIRILSEYFEKVEAEKIMEVVSESKSLSEYVKGLDSCMDDFDQIQSHDIRKADLERPQKIILEQCTERLDPEDDWTECIKQEIYSHWIDFIESEHRILKAGYFEDYDKSRDRLKYLMNKKFDLVAKKIAHKIESHAKFGPGSGIKRTKRESEYNRLKHDLGKKRRVKPVRRLIEEYDHILFDIAPCWLASPDMISNIFPLEENMFDLIIVDEASQLAAERAMPFLYRGDRLMIAGDEKQLKPFDLFRVKEELEEDEQDDTKDIESLLVLAKRRISPTMLRWHYRSKWQELIDFSNHAFYNGMLQVSPNVEMSAENPPIEFIKCESGMWENRSNREEANAVINRLFDILQEHKNGEAPTIGIITFNDEQRNTILDEIELRRRKDPLFDELYSQIENPKSGRKDDEIFVRNIENVQGDERDIIIFSVGYAKDHEGTLRMNFGTLSQDGGENRLNVAVTRASKKMIIVSSIDPLDMNVTNTKNLGPKRLRQFIQYAQAVSGQESEKVGDLLTTLSSGMSRTGRQIKSFDSTFEELVHDRLEAEGYDVETQIGESGYRIDLAIVHPLNKDKYILGIECDGATFHTAKSVRERDVIRQQFLEMRGWKIERIWSRNWWKNPDREISRIRDIIESQIKEETSGTAPA